MDEEGIIICQKHRKREKKLSNVPANYFLCMNRYCPNSFTVLCQACKPEHRDHTLKILSIQDVSFLVDRLLKTPFMQFSKLISECIDMMRKFKLIREFKKKIDRLESQIQKQVIGLIEITENLISEYAQCKKAANTAAQKLFQIDQPEVLKEFKKISSEILSKMDYNFKKDRLQYGGLIIKEIEDERKKTLNTSKNKIEEVKDYSMKIIQVILNNEDSDDQEEQILVQKKVYECLKQQIFSFDLKIEEREQFAEGHTKSTVQTPKYTHKIETSAQTTNQWMGQEKKIKDLYQTINQLEHIHSRAETDFKNKIAIMQKQKDKILKEKEKEKKLFDDKKQQLLGFQKQLRQNRTERQKKNHEKNQILQHFFNLVSQHTEVK